MDLRSPVGNASALLRNRPLALPGKLGHDGRDARITVRMRASTCEKLLDTVGMSSRPARFIGDPRELPAP